MYRELMRLPPVTKPLLKSMAENEVYENLYLSDIFATFIILPYY